MEKVISLAKYRQEKKVGYLKHNQALLDRFFESFVTRHFRISFPLINDQYMAARASQDEVVWDYHDFREALREAIEVVYGETIWDEIRRLSWFDPRILGRDEVVERCTSYFILSETIAANQ